MSVVRKWVAFSLRVILISLVVLAVAGFEWRKGNDNMNVLYLVDRSLSIPPEQQEAARVYVNSATTTKRPDDKAGVIVFGENAGIELMPGTAMEWASFQAVINQEASHLGDAIRLATAAFPDDAQKKLVILSDANADPVDARKAAIAARTQGVTIDAIALGAARQNDVIVRPLQLPGQLKKGQAFNIKSIVTSSVTQPAKIKVFRNQQFIGEESILLDQGENAFSFEENLDETGFYHYEIQVEAENDDLVQNNSSFGQTFIKGDPSIALITEFPQLESHLIEALTEGKIKVDVMDPATLFARAESMRFYDAMILSNIPAGRLNNAEMNQLHGLVRDFGMGMVVIGGDESFTAGSYRGTPLEDLLPLSMNLDSKKVLPRGALALIMHGMEFMNGNAVSRQMALGTLDALGTEDELGVLIWDGNERWLVELQKVGNRKKMREAISGMNQGDLPSFRGLVAMAHQSLAASSANIKHIIVFSDGDPTPPTLDAMEELRNANITVSAVLIAGHASDDNMIYLAENGNGNFYHITDANDLPQVFLQETAIILKTAIIEENFVPEIAGASEVIRGISAFPALDGYVATVPKDRAAVPLLSAQGDPILANWNYGLGKTVAFTSDARTRWANSWVEWNQYSQFWQQVVQWAMRKVDSSSLDLRIIQNGQKADILIEALNDDGDFLNFLNLDAIALTPSGKSVRVKLQQSGPGQYQTSFPMTEKGSYQINVLDVSGQQEKSVSMAGTSLSYSPEFSRATPDLGLLSRLADLGGGKVIDPELDSDNPFFQGRQRTFTPDPIWDDLLILALLIFLIDVGYRRIDLDAAAIRSMMKRLTRKKESNDRERESHLSRLKKVKEMTTPTTSSEPKSWKPAESIDTQKVTPAKTVKPAKPAGITPERPDSKSSPAPTSRVTSRLLDARRKAQNKNNNNNRDDK